MQGRITSQSITKLAYNEVFVFGSNLSGIHGGGAAKVAFDKFGAIYGQWIGLQGKSYAIPTKSEGIKRTLEISEIKPFIDDFIEWAKYHKGNVFLVTEIGCGLAGYEPMQIAPLFESARDIENIHLPKRFWDVIFNKPKESVSRHISHNLKRGDIVEVIDDVGARNGLGSHNIPFGTRMEVVDAYQLSVFCWKVDRVDNKAPQYLLSRHELKKIS